MSYEPLGTITKEDRHPVIAKIQFKDKHVDVKLNMRAKLIEVKEFSCTKKHCWNQKIGSKGNLTKMYEREISNKKMAISTWTFWEDISVPKEYIQGQNILCPECKSIIKEDTKQLIKVYVKNNNYVDAMKLLNAITDISFRKSRFRTNNGEECSNYYEDIDSLQRALVNTKQRIDLLKNEAKIELFPFDLELLKTKLNRVKHRKMEKLI
jgi:hypothetical protein